MKKIINTFLVLALVLIQLIPSSIVNAETISGKAEDKKGTITIDKAIEGKTYTIYRIFDLESYSYDKDANGNITNPAFVYKVSGKWTNFINQDSIKGVYVKVDADGVVTWVSGADVQEFAKLAFAYAKGNIEIKSDGQETAGTEPLVFNDLPLGYYLVDSTVGTLCSLNTTKPNVTIAEKNDIPEIEKKVYAINTWEDENNAKIGDKIEYKTTITVNAGAENYKLIDTMTGGLTPNRDVTVYIGENIVSNTDNNNYTIEYKNNGFELTFTNDYISTLNKGTVITVKYSAVLNENAKVCTANPCEGNVNTTHLEYGNGNITIEDTTNTYTYQFTLLKTKSDKTSLSGAEFKLYDSKENGNVIEVFKVDEGVYRVAITEEEKENAETIKVGSAIIIGLDSDKTYYLEETVQPAGYNKLTSRVEVSFSAEENGQKVKVITPEITVVNYTGAELPSTGGMGTTLFITIGSILALAMGVILVTKLRISKMEI